MAAGLRLAVAASKRHTPVMALKRTHLWIPACFALVAGLLLYMAADRGGGAWLLLWPAGNCAAVAAAYFGAGAGVLGKRPDGGRSPAVAVWMLPFLLVNYATWRLQVLLSSEDCWNEVVPGLYVGRRPRPGEHPPGLHLVVDLLAEFPKSSYHPEGVGYLCLPTIDGFIPAPEPYAGAVARAAAVERVFVHCANGHGRAAAFAAALLVRRRMAPGIDEAMDLIRSARPACRLNPAQRAAAAAAGTA